MEETTIDNQTTQANNLKVTGQLQLEHTFGFCNRFLKNYWKKIRISYNLQKGKLSNCCIYNNNRKQK